MRQLSAPSKHHAVLVELSIDGDKQAFERLYRHWHPRWYRFSLRLLGHPQDARDALQEAALHIATHIGRLRDPATFVSWSFTIVRRRAADRIRANQRQRTLAGALEHEAAVAQTSAHAAENNDELSHALARLPDEQANLVMLFYVYGLTVAELAGVFALPVGTIKSRLHRARQQLRDLLENNQGNTNE